MLEKSRRIWYNERDRMTILLVLRFYRQTFFLRAFKREKCLVVVVRHGLNAISPNVLSQSVHFSFWLSGIHSGMVARKEIHVLRGAVFDSMNDTERRTNGSGDRIKGNGSKRVFRKNDFFGHGMSIIKLRKKYKYKAEKAG